MLTMSFLQIEHMLCHWNPEKWILKQSSCVYNEYYGLFIQDNMSIDHYSPVPDQYNEALEIWSALDQMNISSVSRPVFDFLQERPPYLNKQAMSFHVTWVYIVYQVQDENRFVSFDNFLCVECLLLSLPQVQYIWPVLFKGVPAWIECEQQDCFLASESRHASSYLSLH